MALPLTPDVVAHIPPRPGYRLLRVTVMDGGGYPLTGARIQDAPGGGWIAQVSRGLALELLCGGVWRVECLWERTEVEREMREVRFEDAPRPHVSEPFYRPTGYTPETSGLDAPSVGTAAIPWVFPSDQGRPDHYPVREEESLVITDVEWKAQRARIHHATPPAAAVAERWCVACQIIWRRGSRSMRGG